MKRIILLFAGAVMSFLLLSFIDEYETIILPFFAKAKPSVPSVQVPPDIAESAEKAVSEFNIALSKAYLLSDPSLLTQARMDDTLRASIAEEIRYLTGEGKVMDMNVMEIEVEKVLPLSPSLMQVQTREKVRLRYLRLPEKTEESAFPPAAHEMRYVLQAVNSGWKIISFETIAVEGNP